MRRRGLSNKKIQRKRGKAKAETPDSGKTGERERGGGGGRKKESG